MQDVFVFYNEARKYLFQESVARLKSLSKCFIAREARTVKYVDEFSFFFSSQVLCPAFSHHPVCCREVILK